MTDQSAEIRELEYTLDTKQCADVALFMYQQWQKAMEPPLLIYKQFPDWLAELQTQGGEG